MIHLNSKDQTARLFMQYEKTQNWYEVARPQIHGYDMRCLTFLNNHKYICGADEKVLRVIQAPQSFVKTYNKFKGIDSMEIDDVNYINFISIIYIYIY